MQQKLGSWCRKRAVPAILSCAIVQRCSGKQSLAQFKADHTSITVLTRRLTNQPDAVVSALPQAGIVTCNVTVTGYAAYTSNCSYLLSIALQVRHRSFSAILTVCCKSRTLRDQMRHACKQFQVKAPDFDRIIAKVEQLISSLLSWRTRMPAKSS